MIRSLLEIGPLRRKYKLSQKALASRAGVSQSFIAKIEAGKIDPTYTRTKSIFLALEELRVKEELKAAQLMNTNVRFAQIGDLLSDVVTVMKSEGISQMPVLSRERVCGIVTEGILLKHILLDKWSSLHVGDVMEEAPPIVSLTIGVKTISQLLFDYPIVLVAEKGEVKGVITKTDLLGLME
jgi:predicted transcriptional regulator